MGFYRKRPVVVEAVLFEDVMFDGTGSFSIFFDTEEDLPKWLRAALTDETVFPVSDDPPQLVVRTLEGEMLADKGDWIIKGVKGELYPCKPEIFAMTYEAAPQPEDDVTGVAI